MECPDCKAVMKPLFTGFYCPNDCDRPQAKAKTTKTATQKEIDKIIKSLYPVIPVTGTSKSFTLPAPAIAPWVWPVPAAPATPAVPTNTQGQPYVPTDDQCRDPYCRSKGYLYMQVFGANGNSEIYYQCNLCNKTWSVKHGAAKNNTNQASAGSWTTNLQDAGGVVNRWA